MHLDCLVHDIRLMLHAPGQIVERSVMFNPSC